MVSSLFRLFLLFTQTRAYLAVAEGRHCHHHYCHHHHYDHQSHHDYMISLIMFRYGHCYEYLSGGAMFSACSCLAGTEFVNNKITTKRLLQILQNRDFLTSPKFPKPRLFKTNFSETEAKTLKKLTLGYIKIRITFRF